MNSLTTRPAALERRPTWRSAAFIGFAALSWLLLATHVASAASPSPEGIAFFEKNVRPLFVKHCYECHSGPEASGSLLLDSREGLLEGGDTGPAVVPGQPAKSLLIEAVRYQNPNLQMPPQNRLSPAEVAALEKWIALGAPDPRLAPTTGDKSVAEKAAGPTGMSIEAGRKFWAFQPLARPDAPQVKQKAWLRTPIDAFVLARLEKAGLQPAPAADKRTLLRRVTFDLTGLPPTPAEVEAFLADSSPDAFSQVVERLLASPDYGIRWGRHWLDVARYADSNGLDENLAFGNAWRYRDYVVDAFNADKPFNRFLVEQLAGDLLPGANQQTTSATGFLVLGAKVLAEPDIDKLQMDTIDEQLDTIGKAFMGMTLGCVRCHDHKFDPLKQSDYYALAAIFKSTKTFDSLQGGVKQWSEVVFASDDERKKIKAVDEAIAAKKKTATSFKSTATAKLRAAARAKATEYLVACARFSPDMPLTQVEAIAWPLGLHPHVLHHCRLHLAYHPDDPLFGAWHDLAAAGDLAGIAAHYRPLFELAEHLLAEAKLTDPKATTLADPAIDLVRAALDDPEGFLAIPPKPEYAFDEPTLAEYDRLMGQARVLESSSPDLTAVMGVNDGKVVPEIPIHIRGSHQNLGKPVAREFPEVMRPADFHATFPSNHSGRLELARWLASETHPLTARVYVNRVWRGHFGVGLVPTTENFGQLGERPSHPELLDWLARRFMASGWSTKALHRLILASSVYQESAVHPAAAQCAGIDPENRLLWRFRTRRLEAEPIRDAILAISGRLDRTMGGKSIPLRNRQYVFDHTSIDHTKYGSLRRAIYLPVVRNNLYTFFEQFDFPDPSVPTGSRNSTVVAPQALLMLNSDLVMDSAQVWARQLLEHDRDDVLRVRRAYQAAFAREPSSAETNRSLDFIARIMGTTKAAPHGPATDNHAEATRLQEKAWALWCHSLLASNEFIYLW